MKCKVLIFMVTLLEKGGVQQVINIITKYHLCKEGND